MIQAPSYPHSLELLIELFLKDQLDSGLLSVSEAEERREHLIGNPLQHFGYVFFLKSRGISCPWTREHLSEFWLSYYNEFIILNFGNLNRQAAMVRLRELWNWAESKFLHQRVSGACCFPTRQITAALSGFRQDQ